MRLTFGRYIPTNSIIHRLDPRFKILMVILLIIAIFFPTGFTGYLVLSAVILTFFGLAKLSWKMLARLLLPTLFIFLIILLINFFMVQLTSEMIEPAQAAGYYNPWRDGFTGYIPGDIAERVEGAKNITALGHFFRWKILWFSERALYSAFLMGWRIFLMITLTTILTSTTRPLEITLGLEDLLFPLRLIGIPVFIFSTIISIALRMIPTLIDEAGRIMKAQASRGVDFKHGRFVEKARAMSSLIIPLLVSSFQKAEDLAAAMDARGYEPHRKRTRYHQFMFRTFDIVMFLLVVAIFGLTIYYSIAWPTSSQVGHIPYIDVLTYY